MYRTPYNTHTLSHTHANPPLVYVYMCGYIHMFVIFHRVFLVLFFWAKSARLGVGFSNQRVVIFFCAFLFGTHARARHTYAYVCVYMAVICCVYDFILLFSLSFPHIFFVFLFVKRRVAADASVKLSLCKTQLACMEYEK